MTNVWVLGANGMLGSRVSEELTDRGIRVSAVSRTNFGTYTLGSTQVEDFDALKGVEKSMGMPTHIVNAIGIVKPRIEESSSESVLRAIRANSIFPRNLTMYCELNSVHLIQIATDCVYSGTKGNYLESDLHDPTDVYGKTKSLGEISSTCLSLIRCSIIGRERKNNYSLVEWVRSQELNTTINGFTNHDWNGVTTKVFGLIASGIISNHVEPIGKLHLQPIDRVSKFDLVNLIKEELGRSDILVNKFNAKEIIDRTLATEQTDLNKKIWECAEFKKIPSISEMVKLGL